MLSVESLHFEQTLFFICLEFLPDIGQFFKEEYMMNDAKWRVNSRKNGLIFQSVFYYLSHSATDASDGILKSPRGESDTVTTFGPSGAAERLNCCEKKRRRNTCSQW